MNLLRMAVLVALVWAVAALTVQIWRARGRGRVDLSRPAGSPLLGLVYNFTFAMLPAHKEIARLHPAESLTGIALHLGIAAALARVLLLLPETPPFESPSWLNVTAAIGALAATALLIRRMGSTLMRTISVPDDYLAAGATLGLLVLASMPAAWTGPILLGYTALFLAYLPLGKLRHAAFFFAARAEFGWRLGRRGAFPPARTTPSTSAAGGR